LLDKLGGGGQAWLVGLLLLALSAAGLAAAWAVPRVPAARAEGGMGTTIRLAWEAIRGDRILRLAVLGQLFVWSVATLIPPPVQTYAKTLLRLGDSEAVLPMGALGLGIGLGCMLAGRLSASKVEYGLLPLGALGLTVFALIFAAT